jgi:hypothetical protein
MSRAAIEKFIRAVIDTADRLGRVPGGPRDPDRAPWQARRGGVLPRREPRQAARQPLGFQERWRQTLWARRSTPA